MILYLNVPVPPVATTFIEPVPPNSIILPIVITGTIAGGCGISNTRDFEAPTASVTVNVCIPPKALIVPVPT